MTPGVEVLLKPLSYSEIQSFDRSSLYKLVRKFKARSKVKQTKQVP